MCELGSEGAAMNIDKERLKKLAQAATPGPWVKGAPGEVHTSNYKVDGQVMCDHIASGFGCGSSDPDDAAFVAAANPETVLALLAEIERLSGRVTTLEKYEDECLRLMRDAEAERDQLKAENEALRKKADCVDDCAHLIRKLVHCRRQLATDNALAEKALDYLRRKGLQSSPLRAQEVQP